MDWTVDDVGMVLVFGAILICWLIYGGQWVKARIRRQAILREIRSRPPLRVGADGSCPHCGASLLVAPSKSVAKGDEGVCSRALREILDDGR